MFLSSLNVVIKIIFRSNGDTKDLAYLLIEWHIVDDYRTQIESHTNPKGFRICYDTSPKPHDTVDVLTCS